MTWTYTGDPSVSDRDKVRFLIGDTDTTDQLINDEEIAWALDLTGDDIYQSAHDLCITLGAKFARLATSKSVGGLSLSYSDRSSAFYAQADRLLHLASRRDVPTPWIDPKNIQTANGRDELGMQGHEFYTGIHDNKRS
jgi:hypothetical protein